MLFTCAVKSLNTGTAGFMIQVVLSRSLLLHFTRENENSIILIRCLSTKLQKHFHSLAYIIMYHNDISSTKIGTTIISKITIATVTIIIITTTTTTTITTTQPTHSSPSSTACHYLSVCLTLSLLHLSHSQL